MEEHGMKEIQILLATYNGVPYLQEQLASLEKQTNQDFTLLVSDDGSTDGTPELLRRYAAKWPGRLTFAPAPAPFGNARDNFFWLMKNCNAHYLLFCDQDDVWKQEKIQQTLLCLRELEKGDPSIPVLAFADLTPVDEQLNPIAPSLMEMQHQDASKIDFRRLLFQNIITGCTMGVNKAAVELALQCACPQEVIMHDWWLGLVAAAFGNVGYLDERIMLYRQHGQNSVGAKNVRSLGYILHTMTHWKRVQQVTEQKKKQAAVFLATYRERLGPEDILFLSGFAKPHSGLRFFLHHQHLIHGFWRKIGYLFLG